MYWMSTVFCKCLNSNPVVLYYQFHNVRMSSHIVKKHRYQNHSKIRVFVTSCNNPWKGKPSSVCIQSFDFLNNLC